MKKVKIPPSPSNCARCAQGDARHARQIAEAEQRAREAQAKAEYWARAYQNHLLEHSPRAALQLVEEHLTRSEADTLLAAYRQQEGCYGGRILTKGQRHHVQSFWRTDIHAMHGLPDGIRVVLIPQSQERALGIHPGIFPQTEREPHEL